MPTINVKAAPDGGTRGILQFTNAIRSAFADGEISDFGKKGFVLSNDDYQLTIKGKAFKQAAGELTKGKIKKIDVIEFSAIDGERELGDITGFGNVKQLVKAVDKFGTDFTRFTDFIHDLDWDVIGTDNVEALYFNALGAENDFGANNTMRLNGGNDVAQTGGGKDKIFGGDGQDFLRGGAAKDRLFGGDDSDEIYGDGGNDKIDGGKDGDALYGGEGNDKIKGGSGRDALYGDEGDDKLSGGKDGDSFFFNGPFEGQLGDDRITDFVFGEDEVFFFNNVLTSVTEVSDGVLLDHQFGSVLIVGGDIDDWAM